MVVKLQQQINNKRTYRNNLRRKINVESVIKSRKTIIPKSTRDEFRLHVLKRVIFALKIKISNTTTRSKEIDAEKQQKLKRIIKYIGLTNFLIIWKIKCIFRLCKTMGINK